MNIVTCIFFFKQYLLLKERSYTCLSELDMCRALKIGNLRGTLAANHFPLNYQHYKCLGTTKFRNVLTECLTFV